MPRRERSAEVAVPKQAEVVSFQSLREKRDARRAGVWVTVHVIQGDIREGDIMLCWRADGGHALRRAAGAAPLHFCRQGKFRGGLGSHNPAAPLLTISHRVVASAVLNINPIWGAGISARA